MIINQSNYHPPTTENNLLFNVIDKQITWLDVTSSRNTDGVTFLKWCSKHINSQLFFFLFFFSFLSKVIGVLRRCQNECLPGGFASLFHKIDHDVDCCTAVRQFALAERNAFVVLFLFYFRTLLGNTWASPESLLSGRPAPVGGAVLHKLMRKAKLQSTHVALQWRSLHLFNICCSGGG